MSLRVLGIDPSLTSLGLAAITPHGGVWVDRITPKTTGHDRLEYLLDSVTGYTSPAPELVVIEGPAYSRQSGQKGHHERAGLWWLITHELWGHGIPVAVVSPSARPTYATGKGNAGKDAVLLAVDRRYRAVGGEVSGNDEADALVLAAMGARWLGHPIDDPMPQTHLRAMDKVAWPEGVAA